MRITATQTFLHGRKRYEDGEKYTVDDALAAYFVGNGWAAGPDGYTGPGSEADVTLAIDNSGNGNAAQES